jgi:hypothetical protein
MKAKQVAFSASSAALEALRDTMLFAINFRALNTKLKVFWVMQSSPGRVNCTQNELYADCPRLYRQSSHAAARFIVGIEAH